jgi:hypothetical protein
MDLRISLYFSIYHYATIGEAYMCHLFQCIISAKGIYRVRDSSVGIATGYGLDGPGTESRWDRNFSHKSRPALGPPRLLYNGYRVFLGDEAAGSWCWPPTPFSAEVKKEYSYTSIPSGLSGVLRDTFTNGIYIIPYGTFSVFPLVWFCFLVRIGAGTTLYWMCCSVQKLSTRPNTTPGKRIRN